MKDAQTLVLAIVILSVLIVGAAVTIGSDKDGRSPAVQESVRDTLDMSDQIVMKWSELERHAGAGDFEEFQKYIDDYNTTYELLNYKNKSGIVSLDDFLGPVISFAGENPIDADNISIYEEHYKVHFNFINEDGENTGSSEYRCFSPEECYDITAFMAGNPELEEIFGGECVPDYENYEYFCYLECRYDSGEKAFAVFTNHQIVFYYDYEKEDLMNSFEKWFGGVPEYH